MSSPLLEYQRDLARDDFHHDPAQEFAVQQLEDLYQRLVAEPESAGADSIFGRIKKRFGKPQKKTPEKGLYFWGGVGRGKTYLMDMFYETLPFEKKLRIHFHRFMKRVHHELTMLQGESDPLEKVADAIAARARVLCFDEFFVSDITDAMILAGLMRCIFDRGVCLVTTSNIDPDNLYKDGLQRARFLPAIALLNEHTEVFNIDGGVDHRLRALEQTNIYHTPISEETQQSLFDAFCSLAPVGRREFFCIENDVPIEVEGRVITARYLADDVMWIDFYELCDGPRSQNDYIELAKEFHTVILSDVPQFMAKNEDMARRFILLIDEFYDRKVKLMISAEVGIEELYKGVILRFEFDRTMSRLLEMQSVEYLGEAHKG